MRHSHGALELGKLGSVTQMRSRGCDMFRSQRASAKVIIEGMRMKRRGPRRDL